MYRQIVLPTKELLPYVRNFMISGFDSPDVHLPATVDVQLVIYLRGGSFLPDAGGRFAERAPAAFVCGPSLLPRLFRVTPNSLFIAATFRPAGFFSCFGIPANLLGHRPVPLEAMIGNGASAALQESLLLKKNIQPHAILETFLQQQLRLRRTETALPALALGQLLSPTAELARALDISTRQLERRFLSHHGMPLRDYRRLARFSTALACLLQHTSQRIALVRIAQEAGYVDQAHFTRDFHQFVGATPGRYVKSRGQDDSVYRLWQLTPQELTAFVD